MAGGAGIAVEGRICSGFAYDCPPAAALCADDGNERNRALYGNVRLYRLFRFIRGQIERGPGIQVSEIEDIQPCAQLIRQQRGRIRFGRGPCTADRLAAEHFVRQVAPDHHLS